MRGKFSTYVMGNMKEKSIEKYMDGDGNLYDITDTMKKTLGDLGKDNLYVVGIHKDTMDLCGDIVSMTAFIYTDSYDVFPGGEEVASITIGGELYESRTYYNCYVDNETWDIQEFGSVTITDLPDGKVRRSA